MKKPLPLMFVIKRTYKEWSNYMRSLAQQAGVPDSYRMILTFLERNAGASQKEVAAHCGLTNSAICQTIKEMRLTGYIRQEADENDQRFSKLFLTDKGIACAQTVRQKIYAADDKITALITKEKEEETIAFLEELTRIIKEELPKC